jgi:membrane-associated phospholipid phosphatase
LSAERYAFAHRLVHFDAAVTNWLQHAIPDAARPLLDLASFLGGTPGWLLLVALAFWWSGSRLGVRVALVTSASALLNVLAKWTLRQPRPYFLTAGITALEASDGFGMPSGHAQGAAAAWSALALGSGRRALWILGALATFLAGFARIYYGVHSSLQVVCGWALGLATAMVASKLEKPIATRWARARPAARWAAAIAPAILVLAAGLALRLWLSAHWEVPAEWVARHQATSVEVDPGASTVDLRLLDPTLLARWSGALLGASLAAAWWAQPRRPPLEITTWRQRLIHTVVGGAAAAGVLQLRRLLVGATGELAELAGFAVLLWVLGVGAPWVAESIHTRLGAPR